MKYRVTYYDPKLSRKGQGTQTLEFTSEARAVEFARKNRYQAKPCRVVSIEEATDQQDGVLR